jgi:hypothetical protein
MVPMSFRERRRASRAKDESIGNRLDELEKTVDEIRVQILGANATSISSADTKVEKQ